MGSFKDVVGHKDILKYISSAVENNRVSHAYILNGERGSGKKMLANLFAMTLLCETGDNEPCGKCHSCKQAESGNHPDIIRVTHEKPNSISVDDMNAIAATLAESDKHHENTYQDELYDSLEEDDMLYSVDITEQKRGYLALIKKLCESNGAKLVIAKYPAVYNPVYYGSAWTAERSAVTRQLAAEMGLDYLDMMIIHSPQPWVEVNQSENRYVEGNRAAWKALEDAYKAGKLKAIGVSNFQIGDIESLMETAEIKPMVNQILLHISNTPLELVEYCQKNGIAVEAYSPNGHGEILNQPEIKEMAEKYGVSVPQLCIRYTLQLGAISLPKTANPEHMKANAEVNFEISPEDMETLKNFKKIESYGASSGFPVYGGKL